MTAFMFWEFFLSLGVAHLFLIAFIFLASYAGFYFFMLPIQGSYTLFGIILGGGCAYLNSYCGGWFQGLGTRLLAVAIFLICIFSSVWIARSTFDISPDGQTYHQEAVVELSRGWIPTKDLEPAQAHFLGFRTIYQPKGPEIIEASLYLYFKHLEASKAVNLWLFFSVFFLSIYLIGKYLLTSRWVVLTSLALIASSNPVFLTQSMSFMIDGQMSQLLACLLIVSVMKIYADGKIYTLALFCTVVLLINTKLPGVVYALGLLFSASIMIYFTSKSKFVRWIWICFLSTLGGVGCVGPTPYLNCPVRYVEQIYRDHSIPLLASSSRFTQFMVGLFSKCQRTAVDAIHLKWPLTVTADEIACMANPDTRLSGFGPLFSAIFTAAFILFIWMGFKSRKHFYVGLVLISGLFFSAFVNPLVMSARHAPQIWLIPVIVLVLAYRTRYNSRVFFLVRFFLMALFIINLSIISMSFYLKQKEWTLEINKTLRQASRASEEGGIRVFFSNFRSNQFRLEASKIHYQITAKKERLPAETEIPMPASETVIYIKK